MIQAAVQVQKNPRCNYNIENPLAAASSIMFPVATHETFTATSKNSGAFLPTKLHQYF